MAQEVFVRAWRGLGRFQERAQFSTWLYRIAFNEAQRQLSRRRPAPAEAGPDGDDPILLLPESPRLEPAAQTLDREFEEAVERALDQLTAGDAAADAPRALHRGRGELRLRTT